ncbi:sensor histidine kinase [Glaciimonas immobilis]|uniref:histidine kinase n=1 Tax=Glaciimonas immobilis TaxID=728004 RepID=A0A840RVQ7_9BURK|nr:ATP-binding protein [Glaciimonas immobilis]KAF3996407.1 hypothetical protein HAV38_17255 [Glaciimonas immobilis]MBB5201262.1 signal transduction histidine kinase [Glaciimonas immobilis]
MSNVVKHANATQCTVHVTCPADKQVIDIEIADNGQGFDPVAAVSGIGLLGMKERVHGAAGQLTIKSQPGNGTRILIRLLRN